MWVRFSNPGLASIINVANTAFDVTQTYAGEQARVAERNFSVAILLAVVFVGLGVFAIWFVVQRVARPMVRITDAMRRVASGELAADVPSAGRDDEVGQLAAALRIFRDNAIEKQRMADELLRQERLSALGQLTASVAHELRNPLSAIRNTVFTIKDAATGKNWMIDRPIERIDRSIARCDRIIGELLDYTRVRDIKLASVAADGWMDEVLNEQELPAGIVLIRKLGASGRRIIFDAERMRQVVVNLIENAAQSMKESDPAKERLIIVSTRAGSDAYEFTVEDTGLGISPEHLAKVFEPLFSTKSFGTGLGLPIVKQIIERHGGSIDIASKVGEGTVVIVRLPNVAAKETQAA